MVEGTKVEETNAIRKSRPMDDKGTEESSSELTLGLKEIITNYEIAIRIESSVYDKGEKHTI